MTKENLNDFIKPVNPNRARFFFKDGKSLEKQSIQASEAFMPQIR